jgi:flagellar basal body rod protein FlgC
MTVMFQKNLTDVDANFSADEFFLDSNTVPIHTGHKWFIRKTTLRGGLQEGVEVIEIENGKPHFAVMPTRGRANARGYFKHPNRKYLHRERQWSKRDDRFFGK